MTAFEYDGKILLVDCGVLFPEDHHPGVDLILPGFHAIADRLDDVVGLVLTHGHEDHIGAVPFLLRQRSDIPLIGSKLTLALLEGKLREHQIRNIAQRVVTDGERMTDRRVRPRIRRGQPLDPRRAGRGRPYAGRHGAAHRRLQDGPAAAGRPDHRSAGLRPARRPKGVDLFLVDSTNAEVPGFTTPERDISPALERVFARSKQRVIVACFASHVHRVQQVLDAAVTYGRKVVYVGRSMVRNMAVARDLGYLKVPGNTLIELRDIDNYRPEQVVIISTGSQGEPLSALSRMAVREHPVIQLKPGDTVVLASSLIPGNENAVYRVINGLSKLGAQMVHKGNALVHVSGHASAGELLYCYNIVKPRNVMPVHGEARHLIANANLAIATGVHPKGTILAEDGSVVDLRDGRARIVGKIDAGYIFVDGSTVGDISENALSDRLILGQEGFISVIAVVNGHAGKIVSGPDIHARGFVEDDSVFDPVRPIIQQATGRGPGRRHRRHLPPAAGHPPPARQVGQRHPPPPPDDRAAGRSDVAAGGRSPRSPRRWVRCGQDATARGPSSEPMVPSFRGSLALARCSWIGLAAAIANLRALARLQNPAKTPLPVALRRMYRGVG